MMVYRFGRFELDMRLHQLRFASEQVHVQPRVFKVLCHLVKHSDRAVSREELLSHAWGSVTVADGSLSRAIRGVRAALESDPDLHDAIETVRGYGYRFGLEVEAEPPPLAPIDSAAFASDDAPKRPFVGREAECAVIARSLHACRRGERRVVTVVGEPGSGKTALVRHALAQAAGEDGVGDLLVAEGRCLAIFGAKTPYLPVREALANLADQCDAVGDPLVATAIERTAPSWRSQLPALVELPALIEPPAPSPALPAEEAHVPRPVSEPPHSRMAQEMLEALEWMGRDRSIVFFFEDLHWADDSTLALIASLARRSLDTRLCLICTMRSNEIAGVPALERLCEELALVESAQQIETGPLSKQDVEAYLAQSPERLPSDTSSLVADWIYRRTDGHPLFLERLVDHLTERDWLGVAEPGRDRPDTESAPTLVARLEAAGIPATLGQLLREWLSTLDVPDRDLLDAASVVGAVFDLRAVAAALAANQAASAEAEIAQTDVEDGADRLCARGWLEFRGFETWPDRSHGAVFAFRHALFAEALSAEIPPGRRARLHCAIAERLAGASSTSAFAPSETASAIASHFERGGARAQAAPYHVAAALHASAQQAVGEALHHAERGLEALEWIEPDRRDAVEADLCMAMGFSLANLDGYADDRIKELFERARSLTRRLGDSTREIAASWGLVASLQMRGEIEAAKSEAERLLELAEASGHTRYRQFAWGILTAIAYFQGRFADCVAHARATLDARGGGREELVLFNGMQDIEVTIGVYAVLAHWHLGDSEAARELAERTIARARSLAHPFTLGMAEAFTSIFYFRLPDSKRQREHAQAGIRVSEEADLTLWAEVSRFMEICADPPDPAHLPDLRATLERMARSGGLGGTFFLSLLAERELAAGERQNATNLCRVGIALAERTTERNNLPALYLIAAQAGEDREERARLLRQAAEWADTLGSVVYAERIAEQISQGCEADAGAGAGSTLAH